MKKRTLVKIITIIALIAIVGASVVSLAACNSNKTIIAIPNDTTNEARALLLLEANGIITLREGAGITATVADIVSNPYNIVFREVEAAQLPNTLKDVTYAIINSNYALLAEMNPIEDSLIIEGSASAYANVISVKAGNEETAKTKALLAAVNSEAVKNYITAQYGGAVVCVLDNPTTDGYDNTLDYTALNGTTIKVAASATPHAEILEEVVKPILAAKGITLDVQVFDDYVQPNMVVEDGLCDANYFAHVPYQTDFNNEKGTHIVSPLGVHVEPMGLYAGSKGVKIAALNK